MGSWPFLWAPLLIMVGLVYFLERVLVVFIELDAHVRMRGSSWVWRSQRYHKLDSQPPQYPQTQNTLREVIGSCLCWGVLLSNWSYQEFEIGGCLPGTRLLILILSLWDSARVTPYTSDATPDGLKRGLRLKAERNQGCNTRPWNR